MAHKPLVSIVLVTWNGEARLRSYLHSIDRLHYENIEVIIVDNGSSDETVSFIERFHPNYKIRSSKENLGTSGGSNLGAAIAEGEYIFFTSNDMIYDPFLIDEMIRPMENNRSIGAVACKVRYMTPDGRATNVIDSVGGHLDVFGFPKITGNGEDDIGQHDKMADVFFAFGCSILIRRRLFDELKGYDVKLFTLGDDIDLCWRLRLLGYRVIFHPDALLYHSGSATIGSAFKRSQTRYLSERHTLRMLLKNFSALTLVFILPFYFIILFSEFCFYLFTANFLIATSLFKAVLWNIRNLKNTLSLRKTTQETRIVDDRIILRSMMKIPNKFREFTDFIRNHQNRYWKNFFGKAKKNPAYTITM